MSEPVRMYPVLERTPGHKWQLQTRWVRDREPTWSGMNRAGRRAERARIRLRAKHERSLRKWKKELARYE